MMDKEKLKYGIYAIFIMVILLISVGLILSIPDLTSKLLATTSWTIMFFNTIALIMWAKGMNRINKRLKK
jgi:cell division protein FtsW (lipid II flippase)